MDSGFCIRREASDVQNVTMRVEGEQLTIGESRPGARAVEERQEHQHRDDERPCAGPESAGPAAWAHAVPPSGAAAVTNTADATEIEETVVPFAARLAPERCAEAETMRGRAQHVILPDGVSIQWALEHAGRGYSRVSRWQTDGRRAPSSLVEFTDDALTFFATAIITGVGPGGDVTLRPIIGFTIEEGASSAPGTATRAPAGMHCHHSGPIRKWVVSDGDRAS
jgi:hypothetical protein